MTPNGDARGRIRFGVFEADLRSGELFREGRRVPLPNQSFLALTALLEEPGQVVSREALRARLWPDRRVVEFEQGLNAIINRLREALGDSAANAQFIETLPRRGYRFIAPVAPGPGPHVPAVSTAAAPAPAVPTAATFTPVVDVPVDARSTTSAVAAPDVVAPGVVASTSAAATAEAATVATSAVAAPTATTPAATTPVAAAPAARRPAWRPTHWLLVAAASTVLALAILLSLPRFRPLRPDFSHLRVEPLTSLVGREIAPAFSPDGQRLAFAWNGEAPPEHSTPSHDGADSSRFDLYVKSVDSERTLRLTATPAIAMAAAWSGDGRQLAFARTTERGSGIYFVPSSGGPEKLLASAQFLSESFMQLSWSADGRLLAYAATDPTGPSLIHLLMLNGPDSRVLPHPPSCADAGLPAFSSDAHQLAFVCTSSFAVYGVYVLELPLAIPSATPRLLASLQGDPKGLTWAPGGHSLIIANDAADGSALWHLSLTGQLTRIPGSEEALGPGIATTGGHVAFVREKHLSDIWRVDLTRPGDPGSVLIASTRAQLVPQYSPDGTHVAFQSTRSGSSEIWLANADGSDPVKLTAFNGPLTGAPSWCSDNRRLAFDSRASGTSAIYVVDVLEGRPRRLESSAGNLSLPVWSADCHWIFASDGRAKLYRIGEFGGSAELLTARATYKAAVTDQRVVFNIATAQGVELWQKSAGDGAESPLESMPTLSYSDGWTMVPRGIYFTHLETGSPTVNFYDFDSHRTRRVRSLPGAPAPLGGLGISVSQDEHWLLYTRTTEWQGDIMMLSGLEQER